MGLPLSVMPGPQGQRHRCSGVSRSLNAEGRVGAPNDFAPRILAATVASVIGELTHRSEPGDLETAMAFGANLPIPLK